MHWKGLNHFYQVEWKFELPWCFPGEKERNIRSKKLYMLYVVLLFVNMKLIINYFLFFFREALTDKVHYFENEVGIGRYILPC